MVAVRASSKFRPIHPFRLLLIDDDRELVELLAAVLRGEGYDVDVAFDGQRGLHLALTRPYDVVVIDRALPVLDGLDLLSRLRSRSVRTQALMLTAMGSVHDRIDGLDAGADDYLAKPFDLRELTARLRALSPAGRGTGRGAAHRRRPPGARTTPGRAARRRESTAHHQEFALLRVLATHPETVHTRAALRRTVFCDAPSQSIVDTYVHYLRSKVGRSVVQTVQGIGYRLGAL